MSAMTTATRSFGALFAPQANFQALRDGLSLLWRHRALCKEMVRRDISGQFMGQALGKFWIIGHPLILYVVYLFIFTVVFKTRLQSSLEMPRDYATYILAGLAPWLASQQALVRAPTALIAQANLVKQVVFPIEVLPLAAVVASGIPLLIGLAVIVLRSLFVTGDLPWTALLLPLVLTIHAAFLLGLSYLLAAITPFFRDVKDMMAAIIVVGVYLVPAFYLPQWIPAALQPFLYANPFSYIVWMYQDTLYYGELRHPFAWVISAALAVVALALGLRTFRKLKPYVANVL